MRTFQVIIKKGLIQKIKKNYTVILMIPLLKTQIKTIAIT